jgi:hypothetical protein
MLNGVAPHPSPLPTEREPVTCIGRECGVAASGLAGNRPYFLPVTCIGRECAVAGLWPPWQVSEKPLPVSPFRGEGDDLSYPRDSRKRRCLSFSLAPPCGERVPAGRVRGVATSETKSSPCWRYARARSEPTFHQLRADPVRLWNRPPAAQVPSRTRRPRVGLGSRGGTGGRRMAPGYPRRPLGCRRLIRHRSRNPC